MQLTDEETIKNMENIAHRCNKNTMLPYEYEYTCYFCNHSIIKLKSNYLISQRKNKISLYD